MASSSMLRVTLRIMPMMSPVAINEVPPILTRGKGCPVTGSRPMETPMLIMACRIIKKPNPKAIKAPKVSGRLMTMRNTLVKRMT